MIISLWTWLFIFMPACFRGKIAVWKNNVTSLLSINNNSEIMRKKQTRWHINAKRKPGDSLPKPGETWIKWLTSTRTNKHIFCLTSCRTVWYHQSVCSCSWLGHQAVKMNQEVDGWKGKENINQLQALMNHFRVTLALFGMINIIQYRLGWHPFDQSRVLAVRLGINLNCTCQHPIGRFPAHLLF